MRLRSTVRRSCVPSLLLASCAFGTALAPGLAGSERVTKPERPAIVAAPHAGYHIGPGDVLQITVWKEPDASAPEVVVRSDGMISLPLVREVEAQGLSPEELENLLTTKYAKLIHEPDVSVVVREIHSEVVYFLGGVKNEGAIPIRGPMTVLQAVARAGGLTEYAKRNKMYILRQGNGTQQKIPIRYDQVLKGDHMEQNISLQPGDTVVVPQ
ncbi:MAG TPA: polysaccharide biosynthesis/export family protein [Bryobacteraceae bacterium]|nr:polysaccharide biosynthesis/export family protein [Bryobacteraceae bacterium]